VRWQHFLDKNSYQEGPNPPGWESRKCYHLRRKRVQRTRYE
jgi:hypothetical protein